MPGPLLALLARLLRWSERYTRLDMVYLASGSFWITVAQVGSNVLSLVILIAFANLLPKETYGIYRYILSIAALLNIFSLTGMKSSVARAVAIGEDGALRAAVRYQLKWGALMFLAFCALAGYYFLKDNSLFGISFLVLGVFTPATIALSIYGAYLEGKKEFRLASIFTVLSTAVYGAGMIAALLYSGEIVWLITAYAGATFLSTLIFYALTLKLFRPPPAARTEALSYGKELTLIGLMDVVVSQIDKIIVAHFWGPAQLAVYSLAMAVPSRATTAVKNLVGLGSPKFATKTPAEINRTFYLRVLQGALFGALMTLGYVLVAPHFFYYVLPQYLDAVLYSQILAIGFIFAIPNRLVSLLLISQKLSKTIFTNNLVQNLVRVALYVVLGTYGGVMGLVLAFVAMSALGMLINIITWRLASRTV